MIDPKMCKEQMRYQKTKYNTARTNINQTGQGLTEEDRVAGVSTFMGLFQSIIFSAAFTKFSPSDSVLKKCPHYHDLHEIYSQRLSISPHHIHESLPPTEANSQQEDPIEIVIEEHLEEEDSLPGHVQNEPPQADTSQQEQVESQSEDRSPDPIRSATNRLPKRARLQAASSSFLEDYQSKKIAFEEKKLKLSLNNDEKHLALDEKKLQLSEKQLELEHEKINLEKSKIESQERIEMAKIAANLELELAKIQAGKN